MLGMNQLGINVHSSELLERVKTGVVQVRASRRGAGSGIVWTKHEIISNHHVLSGKSRVTIITSDGRKLEANVIDSDARLDLARLEVNEDLTPLDIGDSSRLRVGELVFAVGHPWGEPWVSTAGIVSGLGVVNMPGSDPNRDAGRDLIRSDVQLRPGNSGGALVNARGELVGINSMIWQGDLGVAVPAHVAQSWRSKTARPKIGVGLQPVLIQQGLERESRLMIVHLEPDGPAMRAGLNIGDVLLEANGQLLRAGEVLLDALELGGNQSLELRVLRAGKSQAITVLPESQVRAA
jgi:serine protease Do